MTFSDLFSKIVTLSKFVGREQRDAKGESMFETLLVQDRDEPLIYQWIKEAAVELEKKLSPFVTLTITDDVPASTSTAAVEGALTWNWDSTYKIPSTIEDLIEAYIADWAMGNWCGDKVAERAEYYKGEALRLSNDIPRRIFRNKPTLS